MSRHRFVRNMDLDDEMNEEEEEGYSQEEQAQMASAMPVARNALKDIKPPISDDAIADSLWHYWFDVEKAVHWLRQDHEKKGEAPHPSLRPTPKEQPRRRPKNLFSSKPSSSSSSDSPQPPLTALQRLSLSRKQATSSSPSSSPAPTATAVSSNENGAKPMSKLALLAQKRKEAAAAAAGQSAENPLRTPTKSPSSSTPASGTQSPNSDTASKPSSKLAQKMAAARAAREESAAKAAPTPLSEDTMAIDEPNSTSTVQDDLDIFSAFTVPQTHKSHSSSSSPSTFFSILTSTSSADQSKTDMEITNLHVPLATDISALTKRFEEAFAESPDEVVLRKRQGRAVMVKCRIERYTFGLRSAKAASVSQKSASLPGKPRTQTGTTPKSKLQPKTQPNSPVNSTSKAGSSGTSTPTNKGSGSKSPLTVAQQDLAGLHLDQEVDLEVEKEKYKESAALSMKTEELIAKVRKEEEESGKKNISMIVVGHVDAGKSTLMGRLLYDIGELSEKEKTANERGSKKIGKGSFAFAWGLDALGDERDRGVTIDIATTHFTTPHRNYTLLDAPGHRDFIPAMISGAAQADVALMVVDGSPGEFEAGFERGGQTREHAWLVRSLGVKEIIVGINKMDLVSWSQDRYEEIVEALKPFLLSAGFASAKTTFMPLAAMEGINILENDVEELKEWYDGPTLINALDKVEVPSRPYESPLRIPVSNVFKGQTAVASGVAVSGRLCSGVVQVGDRLRAIPGDEVATVRTIEVDEDSAPYAVSGQNVTLYLSGIDSINLSIGTILCPTSLPVPLVSKFTTQILVFDLQSPIIIGTSVELFHHSVNLPATISRLINVLEKGQVTKKNPRVLQKGMTATIEITLRSTSNNNARIPIETSQQNKEMGRVLIRRNGETIAAGVVTELLG
ncbi:elongation factor 1 alpha-like protein [Kwoniella mangroviensis CBS 10435]|uniref:Elongation factor 1 alpha-like protein n=1 Tax=Kwoniella mangroviensis CBS 10435 TaxID=1331196 RepID=A0A1B9IK01_9TREE|nr:elongation factor 1 alpha-like protein [Kwoniella mangroviensis CBS 10435]